MSGNLEFLLSPEEKSFLKAARKHLSTPTMGGDGMFKSVLENQASTFPTIDYSYKSSPSVLHDIISLVSCHLQEFSSKRPVRV